MSLEFTFREALPRDAEPIARLHTDGWRRTSASSQFVMIAERDTDLAGFICVFGNEDVLWGSLIDTLHVAPAYSRRGIGTRLMAHAAEWLRTNHANIGVYLWTLEANAAARQFYEQLGGLNVGTRHRLDAEGGSALYCRYVWQRPQALAIAGF